VSFVFVEVSSSSDEVVLYFNKHFV